MTARSIVLWRHGRTAYNASWRLQGQIDIPLDAVGTWQVATAAEVLGRELKPALVVSSDLGRAVQTAHAFADRFDLAVRQDPRLRERGFGPWEGLNQEEIVAGWPEAFQVWQGQGDPEDLGIESRAEVGERMAVAVAEHAAVLSEDEDLLVVSHGAAISLAVIRLLGLDATWRGIAGMNNAHWSVLRAGVVGASPAWRLVAHNVGPLVDGVDWNLGPVSA